MGNFTFNNTLSKKLAALLVLFAFVQVNKSFGQTYCNSNFTSVTYEYLTNVTYAGINNTTGGNTGGPVNYLSLGPANVTVGTANNLSVTIHPDGGEYVYAFIDWNHNGTLNDAGEVYTLASSTSATGPFTVSVTPPPAAYIGTTRMRVMLAWNGTTPNPCYSATYGEAEDYTVNVQSAVSCSTVTFPASATSSASPSTICVSGNVTLSMTPATTMPSASGITYKWQSCATIAGTYIDVPGSTSSSSTYTTTTPITTTTYFKCVVLCNGSSVVLTSAPVQVVVNNPGIPTVTGATRCGPGSLTLTAVPPAGSTINWYTSATGGTPIATTNTYTTPVIPATTTYYASAASGSSAATPQIGTGTGSLPDYESGGPFSNYYRNQSAQYLYTAAEIIANGGGSGTINTIAFNCTGIPIQTGGSNTTLPNYKIFIGTVPSTTTTLSWQPASNLTQVFTNSAFAPVVGWNTCTLTTPFPYNGVDNIVIAICYDQTQPSYSSGNTQGKHQYTAVSNRMLYFIDDLVSSGCGQTGASSSTYLPNVRLGMTLGCNGPRQPVVATITPGPAIDIAKPAVVCSGEIGNIVVTSAPMSNYTNYTWTPNVADLYTNAGATTAYTSGSAPNVYFKSTADGAHTYYLFSSGATTAACTHADTFSIWVQPDSVKIKAVPDSICVTGNTTLSLLPATGYAPNTLQWQESINGVDYNNINGATGLSYTTPTLSANHYYRILIKSTNDTCEMPVKLAVVVNPQLLGVSDSFNCGPGTVTLKAQTGGNSTAKWYDAATGGSLLGSGSPWITPSLNASQTYYVSAEGSSSNNDWQVGTGTGSYGGGSSSAGPFSIYYRRYSQQYLYTAADMLAAGATPGQITYIAFNCTAVPAYAIPNYTIKIKFVPSTLTTLTWQTSGLTQVYNTASFMPTTGWNTFPFSSGTPIVWNGTDNIVFELCHDQVQPTYTSSGNHQYTTKTGRFLSNNSDAAGSSCGVTGTSTSTYLPNIKMGRPPCQTPRQAVHANIYPKPVVDLGQNINECVDGGSAIVLDAGVQPNNPTFLWDDYTTSQVRAVNTSGTYHVAVTNQYTCVGSDTVSVVLRKNPVVLLGNDTTVCNGVTLTLNPGGGGIDYFWSTGQTGQTINVNSAGSYSVFVTNAEGCMATDTIQVLMQGELPTIGGIQVSNDGQRTFHFTAVYPQNVIGYDWNFGDGSQHSYEASPTHEYETAGDYVVVLHLSSTCGFADDTMSAHIVGVHELKINNDELMVYPNPSNGQATILNKGDLKMERIEIYNILGQVVYRSAADAKDKHVINLGKMASGVYTVEIYTDKGTVARKLEIIR